MQVVHEFNEASAKKRLVACTECRKRKQKCSHGSPCTGCARRFPQPVCQYPVIGKRSRDDPAAVTYTAVSAESSEEGLYSHLDLTGIKAVIDQVAQSPKDIHNDAPSPEDKLSPVLSSQVVPDVVHNAILDSEEGSKSSPEQQIFKLAIGDKTGKVRTEDILEALTTILDYRLNTASFIVSSHKKEWQLDTSALISFARQQAALPRPSKNLADDMWLPMEPTSTNKELVRLHLQLLSRFKVSIHGNPAPESRYMRHWVPFSMHSPLLLRTVLVTAASFLKERNSIPDALVLTLRNDLLEHLRQHIESPELQTTDVTILTITQTIIDSWYWAGSEGIDAHVEGLKRIITLRGGLQNLGLQGFLSKTILMHDMTMALGIEQEPRIYGHPGFEFVDSFTIPMQATFNTPFLVEALPFSSPACSLGLHPLTICILDDVRLLYYAVLEHGEHGGLSETTDLQALAESTYQRVLAISKNVIALKKKIVEVENDTQDSEEEQNPERRPFKEIKRDFRRDDSPEIKQEPIIQTPPQTPVQEPSSSSATSPTSNAQSDTSSLISPIPEYDLMHECVRRTALIHCKAIASRTPTSKVLTPPEAMSLWIVVWQISLARWGDAIGIFTWVMTILVPSIHGCPDDRFIKTFLVLGYMSLSMENWQMGLDAVDAGLRIQRWLRG